ncbi:cysteine-rich CWC family protein [Paenibacillus sp. 453mf]|uniref:cysteine-rich CWC family protein n=1 Tax=Paenibacillus sp. 453mf TaxID=1761874 RepID=UPI0008E8DD2C|nr:cysteine-rich CWC family protein [Paenibacillus sp. 453mf]SFS62102.1 Cysteine-rich CWC [Paenibacillus sp. 453mf]
MPSSTIDINPHICPLCHKPNGCAHAAGKPHTECWCMSQSVPKELLSRIPDEQRRKACVCEACVTEFHARGTDEV